MQNRLFYLLLPLLALLLSGCAPPPPPKNVDNLCSIFKEYPAWYKAAKKTQEKWKISIPNQMAVIHQESHFDGAAKPDRQKLLWVIPWTRPSNAYGYSQALKNTWNDYEKHQNKSASRDNFSDASDFIGWYSHIARKKGGIDPNDPYQFYLAYHEGIGGYQRKTWQNKPWLVNVAKKVAARAKLYQAQLAKCGYKT